MERTGGDGGSQRLPRSSPPQLRTERTAPVDAELESQPAMNPLDGGDVPMPSDCHRDGDDVSQTYRPTDDDGDDEQPPSWRDYRPDDGDDPKQFDGDEKPGDGDDDRLH